MFSSLPGLLGSNSGEDANFGKNNYEKKMDVIANHEEGFNIDDVAEVGGYMRKFLNEGLPKAASQAYGAVVDTITPGFIKRMKNKKIFAKQILDSEK